MPSSQSNQNCCRFASLLADDAYDPVKGNNDLANQLFNANTSSVTEPSAIKATLSTASLQGQGLTTIIAMVNGIFEKFYAPFTYVPNMGAAASNYRDKQLAIHGDLMGKRSFTLSVLPNDVYHQTTHVLTYKPDHMSAHFVANPTATSVGPFDSADESKPEVEKIKSRKSSYLPHNLGSIMSPENVHGLTVAYFWITVYPVIVTEGTQAEHQHLIQFFQVAATLRSTGGTSVVNHSSFEVVTRDEGVFETVEQCILDRLFPNNGNNSGSIDNSGFKEVAKEIGALAASQQKQAEEAEERRQKKEDEKYSFAKILGSQTLKRIKLYNGLNEGTSDEALVGKMIPFFERLSTVKSTKDSDVLKALQEALEDVFEYLDVDPEDAAKATPQMLKALREHWERIDTDSLATGVGANLFLHGPRCAKTAEEQIEVFHATLAATNAPDAEVLKQLYSGEIYIPTIADVGYTLRSMMWFFMAVTVPGHPHVQSLKKVINKWTGVERKFNLDAMGDRDPARGIYLLEALNMVMNDYWMEQRKSDDLIRGWDGLQIFKDMKSKRVWKPVLTPTYRNQLKLDVFNGVYGSHTIATDGGGKAQVMITSTASHQGTPQDGDTKRKADEDSTPTPSKNSQVENERYRTQGVNIFGRFKKRKDPATGREYAAKVVRTTAAKPLPDSKTGKGSMCLAYHCKGQCNEKCPLSFDHIPYTDEQYKELVTWCEECYPGSDM